MRLGSSCTLATVQLVRNESRVLSKCANRLLIHRIAGLLASPSLAPTKLDELRIKANILSSFVTAKAEEAYDTTAEAFFDAAGKVAEGAEAVKDKVEEKARQIKAEL